MDILAENGTPAAANEEGFLVIKTPWPAMLRTVYKDPDRYVQQYWSRFPGVYTTGDSARRDEDGYYVYAGRADDMLKVGGVYVSPAEVESALITHDAVLEAAVVGHADESELIKPKAFVARRDLPNGNFENEYSFRGTCRYIFEYDPPTRKIVAWRFEGSEQDCAIVP